jgi:DNA polymerase III alpha subunit
MSAAVSLLDDDERRRTADAGSRKQLPQSMTVLIILDRNPRGTSPGQFQRILVCRRNAGRDGRWLETAGLVLLRQRPGSAKGVLFITIEDETGIANLVIWPSLFKKQRRIILSAGMMAVHGRIQRRAKSRMLSLSNSPICRLSWGA